VACGDAAGRFLVDGFEARGLLRRDVIVARFNRDREKIPEGKLQVWSINSNRTSERLLGKPIAAGKCVPILPGSDPKLAKTISIVFRAF